MTGIAGIRTIVDALLLRSENSPDALAYSEGDESITWTGLLRDATALAGALASLGVEPGARCAVVLPSSIDFVRAAYGALLCGAAIVALNPQAPPATIARRLRAARCAAAIVEPGAAAGLEGACGGGTTAIVSVAQLREHPGARQPLSASRWPEPTTPAFLQFTSGTTGEPRAAVVRHANLIASLGASVDRLAITPDDVTIGWVPLYHDLGLVRFFFGPLMYGCPGYLLRPAIGNLRAWLETASRFGGTITGAPDFVFRMAARLVDPAGLDLRRLRIATNGGEPVRLATIQAFEHRFGLEGVVRPGYGLAEATLGVSTLGPGEPLRVTPDSQVSSGRPFENMDVRIVGNDGRDAASGTAGEIVVRGPAVFAGYFDDPGATADVLKDGWLWTGDQGHLDADGYLFVQGRSRALIKRGGATIAPREIEEAADAVAEVRLSAAVGLPDPAGGDDLLIVTAEVKLHDESDLHKTAASIATSVLHATGIPVTRVLLVKPRSVPRTANGKIRYGALRDSLTRGSFDDDGVLLCRWPE